ncbi:hypothetical protein V7128_17670 [Neobacillus vireti]|uniref:DUF6946 family protein n=1 Tax=Neobacillus vireti TaxID=220686 RepID=UPI0030000BD9
MLIKSCTGRIISTVEDWGKYSPPALKERQWIDGRSAKELAKLWICNGVCEIPAELTSLLKSNICLRNIEIDFAIPEYETALDGYGKGRIHDLLLQGKIGKEKVIISIEAKADEPFGPTIRARKQNNPINSNIHKRIAHLSRSLFTREDVGHLRYQLLYGIGGTLIEAKRREASFALFMVHNFLSPHILEKQYRNNTEDLNNFVSYLLNKETILEYGDIVGPIHVPGGENISRDIPLFIGKIKTVVNVS